MTMTTVQLEFVKTLYVNDGTFRALIQDKIQKETATLQSRLDELRQASEVEGPTAPVATPVQPKRRNSKKTFIKMDALRAVLNSGATLTSNQIHDALVAAKTPIESKMLSSYIYGLCAKGELKRSGDRGSYQYSLAKK